MKFALKALAVLISATPVLAPVGGRCSNDWRDECINLDYDVYRKDWGDIAYTGSFGNWPCPNEPDKIMAYAVKDCPGYGSGTRCLWREGCRSVNSDPFYPGGRDFVCCNHNYLGN